MRNSKTGGWLRAEVRKKILEGNGYLLDERGRLIHRVVCEQAHGKFPSNWVVHHIDESKQNNTPQNLIAMPAKLHDKIHKTQEAQRVLFTRKNIEDMIKCYINLNKNKNLEIQINITVSYQQVKEAEAVPVKAKLVNKSGSSLYR